MLSTEKQVSGESEFILLAKLEIGNEQILS